MLCEFVSLVQVRDMGDAWLLRKKGAVFWVFFLFGGICGDFQIPPHCGLLCQGWYFWRKCASAFPTLLSVALLSSVVCELNRSPTGSERSDVIGN